MGIGLGFGLGPLRVYVPLTGRRRGSRSGAPAYGVCGINHRSPRTASGCPACRVELERRAAVAANQARLREAEAARRKALTPQQRMTENLWRVAAWSTVAVGVGVIIAALASLLQGSLWASLYLFCANLPVCFLLHHIANKIEGFSKQKGSGQLVSDVESQEVISRWVAESKAARAAQLAESQESKDASVA